VGQNDSADVTSARAAPSNPPWPHGPLEHGTPLGSEASRPQPGSATTWRYTPPRAVTPDWILLIAGLAVCLGLLLGTTWTIMLMQPRLRRQAEDRHRLNKEWLAVRTARQQQRRCPYCELPLTEFDRYSEQAPAEDPPDDD
jgi:hypothetical protein